jgi:hypothetical protein
MDRKLSRRELASALAAASALPPAGAGQAPQPGEDLLENARQQVARNAEQLSKHSVAVSVEPAIVFRP